ncbi:MAG: hypothetical protein KDD25_00750 [Bdellovibrionales bacterium]|nr:hypothetical protein [Bdellovibrionales bacterium]
MFKNTLQILGLLVVPFVASASGLDFIDLNMYGDDETTELIKNERAMGLKGRASDDVKLGDVILVGNIPSIYAGGKSTKTTTLAKVTIRQGVIESIQKISIAEAKKLEESEDGIKVIQLTQKASPKTTDYDIIYPGLIDLHNHPKQNNLPTWGEAHGQFANRFEWSDWSAYKNAVSGNMNPWVGYHPQLSCATFRWSELQAMILGTTYMQGYVSSGCVSNFSIHRVEDSKVYHYSSEANREAAISAPTFLMDPDDFVFAWNSVRPEMLKLAGIKEEKDASIDTKRKNIDAILAKGISFGDGAFEVVKKYCPDLVKEFDLKEVKEKDSIKIVSDRKNLEGKCQSELPDKMVRFMTFHYPGIISRQGTLTQEGAPRVVAHLAEGRSDDPYNQIEFPMLKLLGFAQNGVNLVHAIGVVESDLDYMAKHDMGIVWSPYSNLLLYSETLDLERVFKVNKKNPKSPIRIALGSDWVPTGSKSVLEEVKLAKRYIKKIGLDKTVTDYELFKMMTENPARMIGHFHENDGKENGIGTLAEGANGTVIVLSRLAADPFNNIVEKAGEGDLNLVVVDGNVIYGEPKYVESAGYSEDSYEKLPNYIPSVAEYRSDRSKGGDVEKAVGELISELSEASGKEKTELAAQLAEKLGDLVGSEELQIQNDAKRCKFQKAFVFQEAVFGDASMEDGLVDFQMATGGRKTGLNLNRVLDLQKLLGIHLLSQSNNALSSTLSNAMDYFPSLYSCNDKNSTPHLDRINGFIGSGSGVEADELTRNRRDRSDLRDSYLGGKTSGAEKMKEAYGL